MDSEDAIRALSNLVEVCRDGKLYSDYDRGWELIGRADQAIETLAPILLQDS